MTVTGIVFRFTKLACCSGHIRVATGQGKVSENFFFKVSEVSEFCKKSVKNKICLKVCEKSVNLKKASVCDKKWLWESIFIHVGYGIFLCFCMIKYATDCSWHYFVHFVPEVDRHSCTLSVIHPAHWRHNGKVWVFFLFYFFLDKKQIL